MSYTNAYIEKIEKLEADKKALLEFVESVFKTLLEEKHKGIYLLGDEQEWFEQAKQLLSKV